MRFKSLGGLQRRRPREIKLGGLPEAIAMSRYAQEKSFKINELVREIHGDSFEWYGYTLAARDRPEVVLDIGLPVNEANQQQYVSIDAEKIAAYQENLSAQWLINGWIHSHGDLELRTFSSLDEENHATMLDFVFTQLRRPLAKREVVIDDLALLVGDAGTEADLAGGSVTVITDAPVAKVQILEAVYGGFCYAVVIGDAGWHHQEIHYKERAILSGQARVGRRAAEVVLVETGQLLTASETEALAAAVRDRIKPVRYLPPKLETM